MINIKQLLLEGAVIELPYQEKKDDWGRLKMSIFEGYFSKPKIQINGARIDEEYPLSDIDIAIKNFTKRVYNRKNLKYKYYETIMNLNEKENYIDTEDSENYDKIRSLQIENQKRKKSTN